MTPAEYQRHVASLLLAVVGRDGFALAGAGAIREHGFTDRPTHDVDLFAFSTATPQDFAAAVGRAEQALRSHGFEVDRVRSFPLFVRLSVTDESGASMDVDFGVNWRAHVPGESVIGPVLSESDAVAGKLSAVYSRGEVRDFLDLDAIRRSGRFSDRALVELGREHDAGFDPTMFAESLMQVMRFLPSEADEYGVDAETFESVRGRLRAWAAELRDGARG